VARAHHRSVSAPDRKRNSSNAPYRNWRKILGECAQAVYRGEPETIPDEISEALTELLSALGELFAADLSGWVAEETNPGYLRYQGPQVTALVPLHLVADYPRGELLAEFAGLAALLRAGSASTICLSGSSTFLGALRFAGDLDFCEYIAADDGNAFSGLAMIARRSTDQFVCHEMRLGTTVWKRPWTRQEAMTPGELALTTASLTSDDRHGKLDAIVVGSTVPALAATNILIWVSGQEEGAIERSFAFQESPISSEGIPWVPRRLAQPAAAGSYVLFLRNQIEFYRRENPVKAVKRALSLSLLLLLDTHATALRALMKRTIALQRDALAQREELLRKVRNHTDLAVRALERSVRESVENCRSQGRSGSLNAVRAARARFTKAAEGLLSQLLREVDPLIGRA
jgi:hypothetical protein